MSFNVGENIGPYRIMEQLGQGGMATVYKAYHAALDRYVALKVLHPAFHEDQTFAARFQREARVVAKLEHPHIVPVYDYAEHEKRPYLVMKFIEGDTLKARLSKGPLSADEIAGVVNSVGSALAYAHKQGILHRDIKPSNVLIAKDGEMYLADFGLARIAQAGESTLSSDSIMGTPQYISPEQALGKKDLDAGTDIYSFGVMLYEMVVGQVPFSADTPFSIIHDHIYTPLPLPMDVNPKVPEPVQRVLLKALAKDRHDRYASVNEMIGAFKNAWMEAGVPMEGTAVIVPPTTMKQAARTAGKVAAAEPVMATVAAKKSPKKKRSAWPLVAGGAVALFACLFVMAVFRNKVLDVSDQFTQVPAQATATNPPLPQKVEPELPTPPPGGLEESPEILAAREAVDRNPNDPDAHLQLALVLWDQGQPRSALEELAQAANLAGPSNREFFLKAAEKFMMREAWVASGGMYLRVIQTYPEGEVPPEIMMNFRESVYKASQEPEMPLFLFFERIDRVDQPLGLVARGRHSLYNGRMEDAKIYLENVKKMKPDLYEAFLFEAELNMKDDHADLAKGILLSLSSDLGASPWIREMANTLLKKIP